MKRTRFIILSVVILVTLVAAVVPAFADEPFDTAYNVNFNGDKNGDNIPDKWNVKGDVLRTCSHKYVSDLDFGPCMMVFSPSSSGAALWQIVDVVNTSWVVVEEGSLENMGYDHAAAKQLDHGRVYYGIIITYANGDRYVLYDNPPGGTYPFRYRDYYDAVGKWAEDFWDGDLEDGTIVELKYGWLVLPGDGYYAIDRVEAQFFD